MKLDTLKRNIRKLKDDPNVKVTLDFDNEVRFSITERGRASRYPFRGMDYKFCPINAVCFQRGEVNLNNYEFARMSDCLNLEDGIMEMIAAAADENIDDLNADSHSEAIRFRKWLFKVFKLPPEKL